MVLAGSKPVMSGLVEHLGANAPRGLHAGRAGRHIRVGKFPVLTANYRVTVARNVPARSDVERRCCPGRKTFANAAPCAIGGADRPGHPGCPQIRGIREPPGGAKPNRFPADAGADKQAGTPEET